MIVFATKESDGKIIVCVKDSCPFIYDQLSNFSDQDLIRYKIEGYVHNDSGPAVLSFRKFPIEEIYYLNGKIMDKKEWEKEVNILKFNEKVTTLVEA